jgi:transketolase
MSPPIQRQCVNTIKGLAMDAVQAADSGHPGMPMGAADMAFVLWSEFLVHDPADPGWADRDRFVLSAGHGSMLLYSLLHLTGYPLSLDDLKAFRQWGSATPGHPEYGHTAGVETTTGPLGQGFCNAVGMAIAERYERERFGPEICDHWIYAIVSDGDLMEGVTSEAASLAGHLGLGRLVFLYDDNRITIDGTTDISFTEDRAARFAAYGWHVQTVDGHDHAAVRAAIEAARAEAGRPSLICCRTHIGHSSPKYQDTSASHGAPLGEDEIRATKQLLGMDPDAHFAIPDEVAAFMRGTTSRGAEARAAWSERLAASGRADEVAAWRAAPDIGAVQWPEFSPSDKPLATRKSSGRCVSAISKAVPSFLGGSADLAGSNGSTPAGASPLTREDFTGRYLHFGVREHGMASICNGMALHGMRPYCATFLVFHDYMRPAVRLAGLMGLPVVYIYTHDSVFLGEDGPTHQPVEHLMSLRLIPNLVTLRPADGAEVVEAWKVALSRADGPTAIALTRQNLPELPRQDAVGDASRGGYILAEAESELKLVIIATGSEVSAAMDARSTIEARGLGVRVVSMPSWELFDAQSAEWRKKVLPHNVPRLSVEAGRTLGWERYVGKDGASVGLDRFGASAPWRTLAEELGLDAEAIVSAAERLLSPPEPY